MFCLKKGLKIEITMKTGLSLYIYDSSTNMINKDSQPSVDQNVMMWK
jgi:hypothetical protein